MQNICDSIIRSVERINKKEKLNILTCPTHERYESLLALTGHNFYSIYTNQTKIWKECYAKKPENYLIYEYNQAPWHINFDLVLSQNKFGQYQLLAPIAQRAGIPLISVEHTAPMPFWDAKMFNNLKILSGDANVFITEESVPLWNFNKQHPNVFIIPHAVDTNLFCNTGLQRKNHILTVQNDYKNRDVCLNFKQYLSVTSGLPTRMVGDTPGFSLSANNTTELICEYNTSRIFLNTAHISPLPTSLLEAMACECAVVSCPTLAIPKYIQHGVNGFLAKNNDEMKYYLSLLLNDENLAKKLGQAARQTIINMCSVDKFIENWNNLFYMKALK